MYKRQETGTLEQFRKEVLDALKFMDYAPVLFLSAKTGQRVHTVIDMVDQVWAQTSKRIPTGVLNDVLNDATADLQPPATNGRRLKIYYITQQSACPPSLARPGLVMPARAMLVSVMIVAPACIAAIPAATAPGVKCRVCA